MVVVRAWGGGLRPLGGLQGGLPGGGAAQLSPEEWQLAGQGDGGRGFQACGSPEAREWGCIQTPAQIVQVTHVTVALVGRPLGNDAVGGDGHFGA